MFLSNTVDLTRSPKTKHLNTHFYKTKHLNPHFYITVKFSDVDKSAWIWCFLNDLLSLLSWNRGSNLRLKMAEVDLKWILWKALERGWMTSMSGNIYYLVSCALLHSMSDDHDDYWTQCQMIQSTMKENKFSTWKQASALGQSRYCTERIQRPTQDLPHFVIEWRILKCCKLF